MSKRIPVALLVVALALLCFSSGIPAFIPANHLVHTEFMARGAVLPQPELVARLMPEAYRQLKPGQVQQAIEYGSFVWIEMTPEQAASLDRAGIAYELQPYATWIGLQGYPFDTRQGEPTVPVEMQARLEPNEAGFHLVQFVGPTQDRWLKDLEATRLRVLQYIPQHAYLVWGTPAQIRAAGQFPSVRWTGAFHPAYKIAPSLANRTGLIENVNVLLYDGGDAKETLAAIERLGGRYVQDFPLPVLLQEGEQWIQAIYALDATLLDDVARLPTVFRLEYASPKPGLDDEVSDQIGAGNHAGGVPFPGYWNWLTASGLDGSGVRIADVDTGCDTNNSATAHRDIQGRIAAFVDYSGGSHPTDDDGHGTHTAGIIAGNAALGIADGNGFLYGLGVAPGAQLVVQNALWSPVWPPSGGWQTLSRDSVLNGAVASSNSWYTGASGAQGYTAACVTHDRMVRDANFETTAIAEPLIMVFSAGNAGPGLSTITEPKEAKNLIVVGASENYRPDNPLGPWCGASANIDGVVSFSSRGPTLDGRLAPTLVAPGSDIASLRSYTGSYSGCGQVVSGQPDYVYMSGTSMACPHVSGAVALITQWWQAAHGGQVPSPAMVKALLVNSATDMGTPDIPNHHEGWGRMNLSPLMDDGTAMIVHDQEYLLTQSGESWSFTGRVADPTKALKVTLVWTDAPGTAGSNAWVNDLDLEVTVGDTVYKGNVFAEGWSVAGGSADYRNNVENVYLQNPGSNRVTIKVVASNVAGDGVPYNGDPTDQDFALVASNLMVRDFTLSVLPKEQQVCAPEVTTYRVPVESIEGYSQTVTLTLGGVPENTPYAVVPVTLTPPLTSTLYVTTTEFTPSGTHRLIVTGTAEISRVHRAEAVLAVSQAAPVAPTLLSPADGAVGVPVRPALSWSALPGANGYRLQLCEDRPCTSPLLDLSDLAIPTVTLTTNLAPGSCYFWRANGHNSCGEGAWSEVHRFQTVRWNQAFADDIEAGPDQWSHAAGPGADGWTITTARSYSPTHAWFSPDVAVVTDNSLWNTDPFLVLPNSTLSFWHRYNLEAGMTTGYDGGVLELSSDGGNSWQDLGPFIVQNPYDYVISTSYGSPIAGRQAWSGDSMTWQEVIVDLSSFAGQDVQVRWRLACDRSVADEGWYLDDVRIIAPIPPSDFDYEPCLLVGAAAHFTATVQGSYTYTWDFGGPGTGSGLDTPTPTFTYTVPGNYLVQFILATPCTTETIVHPVSVCDQWVQSVDFTVSSNPRSGQAVTFTALVSGTEPIEYAWDFGDQTLGSGPVVTHTYQAGGEYAVQLSATNCGGCGSAQASQTVAVCDSVHRVEFSMVAGTVRVNQVVTFTASAQGTMPLVYSWDFGDGQVGTGPIVTHTYTQAGQFPVTLTVTNCGDARARVTRPIVVEIYKFYLPLVSKQP